MKHEPGVARVAARRQGELLFELARLLVDEAESRSHLPVVEAHRREKPPVVEAKELRATDPPAELSKAEALVGRLPAPEEARLGIATEKDDRIAVGLEDGRALIRIALDVESFDDGSKLDTIACLI